MPSIFQRGPRPDLLFWVIYAVMSHAAFSPNVFNLASFAVSTALVAGGALASYAHLGMALGPWLDKRIHWVAYFWLALLSLAGGMGTVWLLFIGIGQFEPDLLATVTTQRFFQIWADKIFWATLMIMLMTTGFHLFARRRQQAKREQELEREKTAAELSYLRGQLNPHFLFNALNSIHVLIRRDPELAADSLAGFSNLLRYQLYRSEADLVDINEEIEQLRQFAELSQLRTEDDFRVDIKVEPGLGGQIPPMIFLPLLENAFKYNRQYGGFVSVQIATANDENLELEMKNAIGELLPTPDGKATDGGIGLTNIRRRLALLYGDDFTFTTRQFDGIYSVKLQIPLTT